MRSLDNKGDGNDLLGFFAMTGLGRLRTGTKEEA